MRARESDVIHLVIYNAREVGIVPLLYVFKVSTVKLGQGQQLISARREDLSGVKAK